MSTKKKIRKALALAERYSQIDGDHHKAWVIDQMVRTLIGDEESYTAFITHYKSGDEGPETYAWDEGIAP